MAATSVVPTKYKCRGWCFTVNNPRPDNNNLPAIDAREILRSQAERIGYAVCALERGESGTEHWQGYVRFNNPVTFAGMKKLFPTAHLEQARGTDLENKEYISKEPLPWADGDPSFFQLGSTAQPGKRNDWLEIKELAKRKASDEEIAEEFPGHFARNYGGIQRLKSVFTKPRTAAPTVYVLYGPPGVGKSHMALNSLLPPPVFFKGATNKWFDTYDGQTSLLLDDFKGSGLCHTELKLLLDRYDYKAEVKGAMVRVPATHIAITTNYDPATWYRLDFSPLADRVTKWFLFDDDDVPPNTPREEKHLWAGWREFNNYAEFKEAVKASTYQPATFPPPVPGTSLYDLSLQ